MCGCDLVFSLDFKLWAYNNKDHVFLALSMYTVHCTIHTFDLSKNKTMNHTNLLSYSLRIILAALISISWFKTSGIKEY